jgi:hypothetical protein
VSVYDLVGGRLRAVERTAARQAARGQADNWYQLRIAASCPPDTRVHVRGGWVQRGPYWVAQQVAYFPALTLDFAAVDQFAARAYLGPGYSGNFATAYAYRPALLLYSADYFDALLDGASAPPVIAYAGGTEAEFDTAAGAEQAIDSWFDGAHDVAYAGDMPLAGIVLRNNGVTGVDGQVQAIDQANRGRSYIWRDLRIRCITLGSGVG